MRIFKNLLRHLDSIVSERSTVFLALPKQEMALYDGPLWVLP